MKRSKKLVLVGFVLLMEMVSLSMVWAISDNGRGDSRRSVITPNTVDPVIRGLSGEEAYLLVAMGDWEADDIKKIRVALRGTTVPINLDLSQTKITKIPDEAFCDLHNLWNCTNLRSAILPNTVTSIGNYAFARCSELTDVNIPRNVSNIGHCAFSFCSKLTSLNIPENVTSIGAKAFEGCSGLTGDLKLPKGITRIEESSFEGCSRLSGILTIPRGVTHIGDSAFSGCIGLTGILIIPEGVSSIGDSAFSRCSGLTGEVHFPSSLTSIGLSTFNECNKLTGVTFQGAGADIGDYAFFRCSELTRITVRTKESLKLNGGNVFDGCDKLTTIYVPEDSVSTYQTISGWSTHRTKIKPIAK